jgi:acyl carrier protein
VTTLETRALAAIKRGLVGRRWLTPPEFTAETLFSDIGADAIDMTCVCLEVEDEFGIVVHDEEAERWTDVASVVATVRGRVGAEA